MEFLLSYKMSFQSPPISFIELYFLVFVLVIFITYFPYLNSLFSSLIFPVSLKGFLFGFLIVNFLTQYCCY